MPPILVIVTACILTAFALTLVVPFFRNDT
jgi:type II secretory pathway component PulF